MTQSFSVTGSFANFNIFIGTLFIPAFLLLSRLDVIPKISFSIQRDIRTDSSQDSVK